MGRGGSGYASVRQRTSEVTFIRGSTSKSFGGVRGQRPRKLLGLQICKAYRMSSSTQIAAK